MRNYNQIGIQTPDVLLPSNEIDHRQWAVVACDQYTSQPEYWQQVHEIVDDSPSTYWLVLPEAYLGTPQEKEHQAGINAHMQAYLDKGILTRHEGFIYIERTLGDKKRSGLIAALDLEQYSFQKGAKSLIRATEGTILDRLPPRIKIRKDALLELPHILILIDDPRKTVIEPLAGKKPAMKTLYDFELMQAGGHLEGHLVSDLTIEQQLISALAELIKPENFTAKYGLPKDAPPFLFAVGDGNHSLATAKSVWDEVKADAGPDHPARYALVEIVNIHDEGIVFEPIHRLVKGIHADMPAAMQDFFGGHINIEKMNDFSEMKEKVLSQGDDEQKFGFFDRDGVWLYSLLQPEQSLTVGNVQQFLDEFLAESGADEVDYVHGDEAISKLGRKENNAGIYLPAMQKSQLFKTVIKDGVLPRKAFSMGEANEKRFYLESRKIR
jgi:hypothetical protein